MKPHPPGGPLPVALLLLAALAPAPPARAGDGPADATPGTLVQGVDFDQQLGRQIPLPTRFRDETGREVALADYFGKRPVVLTLGYYRCPLICGQELNSLARSLKALTLEFGEDFEVVTVSIAPTEKPPLAAAKKESLLGRYGREGADRGWHFLTGEEPSIRALADSVGFAYRYNPSNEQYIHPAGLVILTPEGRVARYFFGMDYPAKDVQLALVEASAGKVGSPIAKLLLFCYDYDPTTGRYTLAVTFLMRALGTLTALGLGAYIVAMLARDYRRRSALTDPPRAADLI